MGLLLRLLVGVHLGGKIRRQIGLQETDKHFADDAGSHRS
jgi:hypothetical protein